MNGRTYAKTKQVSLWPANTHVNITDAELWLMAELADRCKWWRQISGPAFAPLFLDMPCWTFSMLTYILKSSHESFEVVPTEAVKACGSRQSMTLMSSIACYRAVAFSIRTSVVGLSWASVWTFPSLLMTPMPEDTRPKMVCFPSSHGVGANVMKNCSDTRQQIVCLPRWTAVQSDTSSDVQGAYEKSRALHNIVDCCMYPQLEALPGCHLCWHQHWPYWECQLLYDVMCGRSHPQTSHHIYFLHPFQSLQCNAQLSMLTPVSAPQQMSLTLVCQASHNTHWTCIATPACGLQM